MILKPFTLICRGKPDLNYFSSGQNGLETLVEVLIILMEFGSLRLPSDGRKQKELLFFLLHVAWTAKSLNISADFKR